MADEHQEPGTLIVPHKTDDSPQPGRDATSPQVSATAEPGYSPTPVPAPDPSPHMAAANQLGAAAIEETEAPTQNGWFRQESADPPLQTELPADGISWTASEFIAHEKGGAWYAMLAGGAAVLTILVYLISKDLISTVVVAFAAITFGVFAGRKPRTQQYSLTGNGLQIGQKFYGLSDFKTFSIAEDGNIASIVLNPLKRFMPALTIYAAPDIEDKVIDFLSAYLPLEQHKADAVDNLLKRIRF